MNYKSLDKFTCTIKILVNNFCPDKNRGVELEKELNGNLINKTINNRILNSDIEYNRNHTITDELNKLYKKIGNYVKSDKDKASSKEVLIQFLYQMELHTTDLAFKFPDS